MPSSVESGPDAHTSQSTRYARYPSLAGRTVLITGGASGIGATLVAQFFAQGAKVGFIDIAREAGSALVAQLADTASQDHGAVAPYFAPCDLNDIEALQQAIAQIRAHFGPIGILLNNAANDTRHTIASVTPQSWDAGLSVNLRHQFFAAQAVVDDMRQLGGGSIINFGSTSWMIKQGGMPAYTTSKAAIQGLTRSLARDLGPFGIRVNTLVPGWVMTERQLRLWVTEEALREISRSQCLDQLLQADDIARMALFLAADDSAMCTAQDFIVDGGGA
jgi:NAD(P)-dependent dehydrogenase (short-subunit alcohol dehydrogenase family)